MCELFGMSSRFPADVNLSHSELARHGGGTGPHRDGWGVAFHQQRDAWLIKEPASAATSECERFVEQHTFRSTLVLSHIRLATRGAVGFENTQPFSRELGGRAHVAHNGDLPGLQAAHPLARGRFRPLGDTDSEHAFCLLLERLAPLWLPTSDVPPVARRRAVVEELAALLRPIGPANFLYADGDAPFVHGHRRRQPGDEGYHPPGLHVLCRSCEQRPGELVVCRSGRILD
ncbi:MAG TPA: class II glutamine amidotransferase [Thermoanaerobaculia bacterium]|nr:class II glutamine amidotransferase [Thermoanaerobaculia bacterium]